MAKCIHSKTEFFIHLISLIIHAFRNIFWRKTAPSGVLAMFVYVMGRPSFDSVHTQYTLVLCVCVWGNVPLLVLPSQSALTPVSSVPGPHRVDIRVKPFEAGLIASCMTVWVGVYPLHIHFNYVSHIVSDIRGSLCLSLLHYYALLASSSFHATYLCIVVEEFSHWRCGVFQSVCGD